MWKSHGSLALAYLLLEECWFGVFCVLFTLDFRLLFFVTLQSTYQNPCVDQVSKCPSLSTAGAPGAAQVDDSSPPPKDLLLSGTCWWSWELSTAGWWMVPAPMGHSHFLGNIVKLVRERPWFKGCVQKWTRRRRLSWNNHKCYVQLPGWSLWIRKWGRKRCKAKKHLREKKSGIIQREKWEVQYSVMLERETHD